MGSSPLTRGKPHSEAEAGERVRLIPAHAGKTVTSSALADSAAAHPRSRGENEKSVFLNGLEWGSSPLTRGKRVAVGGRGNVGGLIPAHAGKT